MGSLCQPVTTSRREIYQIGLTGVLELPVRKLISADLHGRLQVGDEPPPYGMVCRRGNAVERDFRLKQASVVVFLFQAFVAGMVVTASSAGQLPPGEGMVLIPEGEFLMGSTEKDGLVGQSVGVDEIPQHTVFLKTFYIDRYEVKNGQYKMS